MSSRRDREARKARLLNEIQQQRLDLSAARRDWLMTTAQYDRSWLTFVSMRRYLAIGSSILAIWTVRKPRKSHFLLRWTKRGFGLWSSWRLVRKNLPQR
jgi:hypothetical protein